MTTHESSVNYLNLIRDLAEMYPADISEVVIVELIANSLDAGATGIKIDYNPKTRVLVIEDNGGGMTSSQFAEYHDFAAGLKKRGTGIGFAGVGAKISFNIADRVITETRNDSFYGGSDWYMQSNRKLVWQEVAPSHLDGNGTRVEVRFGRNASPAYTTEDDLLGLVKRHYLPLLDEKLLKLYEDMHFYSMGLRFTINGDEIRPSKIVSDLKLENVKEFYPTHASKRTGYGVIGLSPREYPLGPDICGVALCTRGKVVKWEFCSQFPGALGPRIVGLVEIPGFVDFLTTSKTDFLKGKNYKQFEYLYGPVREEFKDWLSKQGIQNPQTDVEEASQIERELRKIVDEVPELENFFGFRTKKPVLKRDEEGMQQGTLLEGTEITFPGGEGGGGDGDRLVDIGDQPGQAYGANSQPEAEKVTPISRRAPSGPRVDIRPAPERLDMAWIEGNTIVINSGHAAYSKSKSNNVAKRQYSIFAVGVAVQRFLGDGQENLMFMDRFLAAWGNK